MHARHPRFLVVIRACLIVRSSTLKLLTHLTAKITTCAQLLDGQAKTTRAVAPKQKFSIRRWEHVPLRTLVTPVYLCVPQLPPQPQLDDSAGKYCSSQIDCNSYTSCVNSGTRVPDPLDCRNYRYCTYGPFGHFIPTDHSYACSSKYYFDPVRGSCSYGTCTHDCVNICSLECATFENETVAVPNDCSSFYTCTPNHIKIKSQCPPEAPLFFWYYLLPKFIFLLR
ncbi:hypothetical protein Avbf_15190 [Armadillidium vulgare]|nr:hypothetical protein Avbf_15190 [Armadillidium vulgare]